MVTAQEAEVVRDGIQPMANVQVAEAEVDSDQTLLQEAQVEQMAETGHQGALFSSG